MTKHRKRSRSQKGGFDFSSPTTWFSSSPPNPYGPQEPSWWQKLTGPTPKNYQTPYLPINYRPNLVQLLLHWPIRLNAK